MKKCFFDLIILNKNINYDIIKIKTDFRKSVIYHLKIWKLILKRVIDLADTKELISKIMSDEKLQKALNHGEKVYRDEPVIRPASQLKNVTPFRIQKLKNMMWSAKYQILSSERSFYLLSDFMKDYEDDYDENVKEFNHYLPSYYEMTEPQMRAYFSWRTKVRKGEVKKTFLSFAHVYIFELLNLRGADTPEDAFEKLYDFYTAYRELDSRICSEALEWLRDFVVYYDLPHEYADKVFDIKTDEICKSLFYPERLSDDVLFEAVAHLSSYDIKKSEIYIKYEKLTVYAVCKIFRALNEYFAVNRSSSLFGYCLGTECRYPHVMFFKALFYDSKKYKEYRYKISDVREYICSNGRWYIYCLLYTEHQSLTLGKIVEACDAFLRQKTGFEKELLYSLKTKYILKIIKKEIGSIKIRSSQSIQKTPQIEIDVSKLDKIRSSSDIIREKLLVDEDISENDSEEISDNGSFLLHDVNEKESQTQDISVSHKEDTENKNITEELRAEEDDESAVTQLDSIENDFLKLVLENADYHSYIKKNRLLLSVVTDSVNEKLFDVFDDTVLESDGETVSVIDDYREELSKMFSKGNRK